MSRNVPAALAAYMAGNGLHMGLLTKVGPLPDGTYRYFSHLTNDYTYDDGDGAQTYIGRTGMQVSAFLSSADLGVDNAEATSLPSVDGFPLEGFTTEQIKAGILDASPYVTYCVNYTDLSKGHFIWAGGTIGEQRLKGTALINLEQRSITNKYKQNIVQQDSVLCRAIFASQSAQDSSGTRVVERYPCGHDDSADWNTFTVTAVHPTDSDLIFYTDDLGQANNFFRLGMVRWTTGNNVGQTREISSNTLSSNDQEMTLIHGLPHAVQAGDQGEARWGCDKSPSAATGCRRFFDTEWVYHYRGEPYQPSGDASINLIGGAGVPGDVGGTGENPTGPTLPPVEPPEGGAGTPGTPTARTIGADTEDACAHGADPSASAAANVTAINAAIAALAAGGGEVFFSVAGTYSVTVGNTSGLIVLNRDNTRIDLTDVELRAAYSSAVTAPSNHRDVIRVDGADEWEIKGGKIVGYRDAWANNGGVSVHGVSEWAHGIYVTGSSTAGTIYDITIVNCVGDAISLGRTSSDVHLDNVEGSYCRRQGLSSGASQVLVTNCNFHHIGGSDGTSPMAGIDIEVDAPNTASDITISDTILTDNTGPGLICWVRTSDITIEGLTVERNKNHGILVHESDTGSIKGCTIRHNKYYGIRFEDNADGWTVGGAGADKNVMFNNQTATNGTITTGNTAIMSGTSSTTSDHIQISSDSSVTVSTNEYGPT